MATKRLNRLPDLSTITSGGTTTQNIPISPRYHAFVIFAKCAAKTLPQIIDKIRMVINGKTQREFTIAELDDMNKLNGAEYAYTEAGAGNWSCITIHLAEPWRKDMSITDGFAWRTAGLSSFKLEFDIVAGAGAAVIEVYAESDESVLRDAKGQQSAVQLGQISLVERTSFTGTAKTVRKFTVDPGYYYQALSIYDAHVERVQIKLNKFVVFDASKAANDKRLKDRGLVPVASRFDLVFDADDPPGSALPVNPGDVFETEITLADEDGGDGTTAYGREIPVLIQKLGAPN